jgi:hypothetical protein
VLVGGVAQALLAVGRDRLPGARPAIHRRPLEVALWNGGTLVVAAGVLVDVAAVVALGSLALLVALAGFGAATAAGDNRQWRLAYHGLILALTASVIVGCALAFAA